MQEHSLLRENKVRMMQAFRLTARMFISTADKIIQSGRTYALVRILIEHILFITHYNFIIAR